jgi:hypothetical protein
MLSLPNLSADDEYRILNFETGKIIKSQNVVCFENTYPLKIKDTKPTEQGPSKRTNI